VAQEYVEMRNGGYYVAGSRISLDSIVACFNSGEAAEAIWQNFPALTLEQVYGVIAFYLSHRNAIDQNIREGEQLIMESVPSLEKSRPEVYARLARTRELSGRPR
jgi:uncharacterized protein (DUF433 family)